VKTKRRTGYLPVQQHVCFLTILFSILFAGISFHLPAQQKPSRQSSLKAFSKGDYEKAYLEFSELLVTYPRDPLYKYYSGVCLVNLKRDPEKAETLLKEAQQNAAAVRNIPSDAVFWLGRAQQQAGSFGEAIATYNAYTTQAGRKAAKELGIPLYIQQCTERTGNIGQPGVITAPKTNEKPAGIPPVRKDSLPAPVTRVSVNKPVVRETISNDYDKLLSEALRYQVKVDSMRKIIDSQKETLEKLSYKEKVDLRIRIARAENFADSLQNLADIKFSEAQNIMNKTPFADLAPGKDTMAASKLFDTKEQAEMVSIKQAEPKRDSIVVPPPKVKEPVKLQEKQAVKDTLKVVPGKNVISQSLKRENVFSVFEVVAKPVYKEGEKIEINPQIPPGLIHRIQVGVFRNPVAPSYFKGIKPVYGFKASGAALTVYYAGMFRRVADANRALTVVRQKGFKDAFVASFSGGKVVSAERAILLEKEWGKKPFVTATDPAIETPADTVPPVLAFRVEAMRSPKPLKDETVESIRKIAGTRGLDLTVLEDGSSVCLIGTFISFESAEEYADLLIRNGYQDAKVVAWLGKKEIPVETARQLFNGLK